MTRLRWIVGLLLLVLGASTPAHAEMLEKVLRAPHSQRVYDYVGVLSAAERVQLRRQMLALEPQHLAQGAIVVVHRVEGHTLERFAQQILNRWGVGERGRNNGFVILVAIDQRKWRLATGDGLRKKIPDATAAKLMREAVAPSFRRKRYAEGLKAAVAAIRTQVSAPRRAAAAPVSMASVSSSMPAPRSRSTSGPDVLIAIGCILFFGLPALIWLAVALGSGSDSGRSPSPHFDLHGQPDDHTRHATTHVYHDSSPPSPPAGGDYGGGSSSGGGASGDW